MCCVDGRSGGSNHPRNIDIAAWHTLRQEYNCSCGKDVKMLRCPYSNHADTDHHCPDIEAEVQGAPGEVLRPARCAAIIADILGDMVHACACAATHECALLRLAPAK